MISRPIRTSFTRLIDILANQTIAAIMAIVISVLRNRRRIANVMIISVLRNRRRLANVIMIVLRNRRRIANIVVRRRRRGITNAIYNICDVRYRGRKC